jgi:hypothetical protein
VIAWIAEQPLTPKVAVKALLAEGESLGDCPTWADEHWRDN